MMQPSIALKININGSVTLIENVLKKVDQCRNFSIASFCLIIITVDILTFNHSHV